MSLPSILIILAVVLIAVLGGVATDPKSSWFLTLKKPTWNPPNKLFGPVWTSLYILLIISAELAFRHTQPESRGVVLTAYAVNGIANLLWSWIFFRWHKIRLAGFDILVVLGTIIWSMAAVWEFSQVAALLLIPYLLWVSFATVLNWSIVRLNPNAKG